MKPKSSTDRDLDTDSEELEDTNASALNEANEIVIPTPTIDTRSAVDGSYSNGSAFTANTKSITITLPQGVKDGDK